MQTANVKWIGDERFVATGPSGHAVTIDSDRKSNTAMGPMEMLLMALGACTATDIVIILEKKRQKLEYLNVVCSGERRGRLAKFGKFRMMRAVKHAIELSEGKYCSVSAMLKKTATLKWRYEILPADE